MNGLFADSSASRASMEHSGGTLKSAGKALASQQYTSKGNGEMRAKNTKQKNFWNYKKEESHPMQYSRAAS